VNFDLRGLIQLDSGTYGSNEQVVANKTLSQGIGRTFPSEVNGIPVECKSAALHFLLGGIWGSADEGEQVARFVVHYDDGSQEEIPILARVDVWEWWRPAQRGQGIGAERLGWTDTNRLLAEKVWTNPHPEKQIRSLDLISAKRRFSLFVVAITAE
jgi:hypothetical protein